MWFKFLKRLTLIHNNISVFPDSLHGNPAFHETPVTVIETAIKNWLQISKLRVKKNPQNKEPEDIVDM